MHNPFVRFTQKLLDHHIKLGHRYYVRQTYRRGIQEGDQECKAAFLISHYTDISLAKIHFAALEKDGHRFLYDLSNAEHYKKLETAAAQPAGYRIFAPLLAQKVWKPSEQLRLKVKKYIDHQLSWKPKGRETVQSDLFLQFGELFITLKFAKQQVKVPLFEIEKL